MSSARILYVEDNLTDRELVLRHLRQHAPDLEVRVVASGRQARAVMAAEQFDVVLLDYRLPDATGLELLEEFLTNSPDLAVIMVTGSGDHEVAVAALKTGAVDYIIKKAGYLDRLPVVIREVLERSRHAQRRRARGLRLLYVEHNPADIDLTLAHLSAQGSILNVETATTGEAALRAVQSLQYDLMLLDYRMPDMNGLEILQALRERNIHLPVVMVTGQGDEEIAVQALKLGAMDYVVKRSGYLTQLFVTIENAVTQWALVEEKEALLILNGIARAVASTLNLNEVLHRVALAVTTLLKTNRSLVLLLSEDGTELVPAAWHGGPLEVISRLRFRIGEDVPGRVAAERQACSVPDIRLHDAGVYREEATRDGIGGVLSVPIMAHDRLLGVLTAAALGPRTFRLLDERLLADLAAYAAVGIENARMYTELERAAHQLEATVEERTRQLQEALSHVEAASRHKSEFLANMSHELRTPLNTILGFSDLLEAQSYGPLTPKQSRYVTHINQSGRHLLALINDLLDLSKVEAGRIQLYPQPFNLPEALAAAMSSIQPLADQKSLTLALEAETAPGIIIADPLRFKQILYNLLSNAVKFTPEGGRITVSAKPVSCAACLAPGGESGFDCVEIAVTDTGIGIKAEDLGRLFQEFTQLDSSLAKPHQGTGLGLALTKRLITLHGGTVTVSSPGEGQGSTFTVTLPVRPPQTRGRVLVVEDDVTLQAQIVEALQNAGFGVEATGDGETALAQAERVVPDLVILDLYLSGMPSLELLRRLRAEGSRRLPIIVLARGEGDPVQAALAQGADEFLAKPVSLSVLTDAVDRLLKRGEGVAVLLTPTPGAKEKEHEAGQ